MMYIIETGAVKLSPPWRRPTQKPKSSAQQASERGPVATPIVRQAPPPPGMGKLIDKTA
jgi:hypothetical protein